MDVSLYSLLPTGSRSPFPLPCHHFPHFCPLLAAPCLSLLLSLFFYPRLPLTAPILSVIPKRWEGRGGRKVGKRGKGGFKVKWWRRLFFSPVFFFYPASLRRADSSPLGSSLVCTGCRSGDMATGFHPNSRNISSTVESGIAGKDNENGTAWRKGDDEGGGMVHGLVYAASLIKASTAVSRAVRVESSFVKRIHAILLVNEISRTSLYTVWTIHEFTSIKCRCWRVCSLCWF